MSKKWMRGTGLVCGGIAGIAVVGLILLRTAAPGAGALAAPSYGVPGELSLLIWLPFALLNLVCVGGLYWLIRPDSRPAKAAPAAASGLRPRLIMPARQAVPL